MHASVVLQQAALDSDFLEAVIGPSVDWSDDDFDGIRHHLGIDLKDVPLGIPRVPQLEILALASAPDHGDPLISFSWKNEYVLLIGILGRKNLACAAG